MDDRDFIDFKFNGHWASEFNLVAVSNGDRYTSSFFGSVSPNTTTLIGKTGVHKWNTQIGEKVFNINIAYDNLDLITLRKIKEWLNPFVIDKIIFKEEPYKYYWVSLNEEPQIEFLPFRTEDVYINNKFYKKGIYKGDLTLSFICVDNNGYSDWDNFSKEDSFVLEGSNLLNESNFYKDNLIFLSSYEDLETGNPETSGITSSRAEYLYNAGSEKANLNLIFDYIPPQENSPLEINIDKVKLTSDGWETVEEKFSNIKLEYFTDYKPFTDLLKKAYSLDDLSSLPENWQDDWQLEINSDIKEIYFKNKNNKDLIISLNNFNSNQNFLQLCDSNFVDYSKQFPTLLSEIKNSAIENTYFNKIYLTASTQNYRLKNIYLDWKHTYI